ncbi:MAG: molybdopterin-dependent oxidoreductase [Planctomycetes bacterium]|nr:molybdopterin-dependent oxidoreductase [Planctomycetota bacterium]
MAEVVRTACTRDCPDACAILAHVESGRVVRIQGDPEHPVTRGFLCQRTSRYLERHNDPERLRTPLVASGSGFRRIGWNEALNLAVRRLREIRDRYGPASILHYRSGGSLGIVKHVVDHFFARFGPVSGKRGDICSGGGDAAQEADFGLSDSHDLLDLLHSRQIFLWGKNPYVSNVHLVPVLREAKERGAGIVLVDPVRHRTAELADVYLQPRPGGDLALASGVARTLFEKGWTDPEAASYCDGLDGFRALVFSRPLADWARAADVAPVEIVELARRLAERPAAILVGWGMQRRGHGGAIVRALDALSAVSGNLGIPGGGVSFYFQRRGAFDVSTLDSRAARRLCEPLLGREILDARDPEIRAVWITAANPVAMLPDSATVARALETREFVVVVDTHLTDTARRASLVLPTNSMLEADDLVGAYGNHWIHAVRPAVPRGEGVRSDLEIVSALADRLGLGREFGRSPREWKRVFMQRAEAAGISLEDVERGGAKNPFAGNVLFADRRFPTPTGRVRLMTELPSELPGEQGYPLYLLSNSTAPAQCSQWSGPRPRGEVEATCHPDAAPDCREGDVVRIESPIGAMRARLVLDPRQRRDLVLVPKGGRFDEGACANALVPARTTDIGEGAAYLDARVRIVRAPP